MVVSTRTLAKPGVQETFDGLVADGILVRGANDFNPTAYSLAGMSSGITVPGSPSRAERAVLAARAEGFAGANEALSAMGRGGVVAPPRVVNEAFVSGGAVGTGGAGGGSVASVVPASVDQVSVVPASVAPTSEASAPVAPGAVRADVVPEVPSDHVALAAGFPGPISPLATLPLILSLMSPAKREETLSALWRSPGLRDMLLAEFGYAGPEADEEPAAA